MPTGTFTRNSVAYKADGSQVASDQPRFEPMTLVNDDPTAAMLSQSGLAAFSAVQAVDDNTSTNAWHTDTSSAGAWLQIDLGAGNAKAYVQARLYTAQQRYNGRYNVQYSDDGAAWTTVLTGFCPAATGWNEATWGYVGAHRYWRLVLANTPGIGNYINELELYRVDPFATGLFVEEGTTPLTLNPFFASFTGTADDDAEDTITDWTNLTGGTGRTEIATRGQYGSNRVMRAVQTAASTWDQRRGVQQVRTLSAMGLAVGDKISFACRYRYATTTSNDARIYIRLAARDSGGAYTGYHDLVSGAQGDQGWKTDRMENWTIPTGTVDILLMAVVDSMGAYSGQNNWLEVDYFCVEKKPYTTSPTDVARAADLVYWTLPQPLPQNFMAAFWFKPDWASTIPARSGGAFPAILGGFFKTSPTSSDRLMLAYETSNDRFEFLKVIGGTVISLFSTIGISFSAGDLIGVVLRQTSAGMKLSWKIGAGAVAHVSNADTTAFATDLIRLYLNFPVASGYEPNSALDAIVVRSGDFSDADAEAFLNDTNPPVLESNTIFLAQLDGDLTAQFGWVGGVGGGSEVSMAYPPQGRAAPIQSGAAASKPAAGTAGRFYYEIDTFKLFRDNGAAWEEVARQPAQIGAADLGFDPATQAELNSHTGSPAHPYLNSANTWTAQQSFNAVANFNQTNGRVVLPVGVNKYAS